MNKNPLENLERFVSVHKLNCSTRKNSDSACDCSFLNAKRELEILDKLLFALFEMRKYQILYFKNRLQGDLKIAKQWEVKVDKHYAELRARADLLGEVTQGRLLW